MHIILIKYILFFQNNIFIFSIYKKKTILILNAMQNKIVSDIF